MKKYKIKHYKTLEDFGTFDFEVEVNYNHRILLKDKLYTVEEVCHVFGFKNKNQTTSTTVVYVSESKIKD